MRRVIGIACIVFAAAACAAQNVNTAPIAAVLPALLNDAAKRSAAAVATLRVASVEAVTWPDSSLGCPQDGLLYMQVLVPGHRVRIVAPDGAAFDYHLGSRERWVHCPADRARAPLPLPNPRI
jgi:hypothetical protein